MKCLDLYGKELLLLESEREKLDADLQSSKLLNCQKISVYGRESNDYNLDCKH